MEPFTIWRKSFSLSSVLFIMSVWSLSRVGQNVTLIPWKAPLRTTTLANHDALDGNMNGVTGRGVQRSTKARTRRQHNQHIGGKKMNADRKEDWHLTTIIWELLLNLDKKEDVIGRVMKEIPFSELNQGKTEGKKRRNGGIVSMFTSQKTNYCPKLTRIGDLNYIGNCKCIGSTIIKVHLTRLRHPENAVGNLFPLSCTRLNRN